MNEDKSMDIRSALDAPAPKDSFVRKCLEAKSSTMNEDYINLALECGAVHQVDNTRDPVPDSFIFMEDELETFTARIKQARDAEIEQLRQKVATQYKVLTRLITLVENLGSCEGGQEGMSELDDYFPEVYKVIDATAAQAEVYKAQMRQEAMEEAAKICELPHIAVYSGGGMGTRPMFANECAEAIRAAISPKEQS